MPEYDIGFGPLRGPGDGGVVPQQTASLVITGLVLAVDYVKDARTGSQTAVVKATWNAPTVGEDLGKTTKNKVVEYWVSERQGTVAQPDLTWSAERKVTVREAVFRGLNLSTLMDFRVRARTGGGQYGPYTNGSINTALDTTPPDKPSTPILKGALRGVTVTWDGLDDDGEVMPNDFDRCEIEISTTGSTAGFNRVGTFDRNGGTYAYNTPNLDARSYWARLRAFDKTGNFSPYSDVAGATSFDFTAAATIAGQSNAIHNASFESTITPQNGPPDQWDMVGAFTSSRDGTWSEHQGSSQRLSEAVGQAYLSQTVPLMPDQDYVFSVYLNKISGATFGDRTFRLVLNDGTLIDGPSYSSRSGGEQRVMASFHTSNEARSVEVQLYASSGTLYWDAAQLEGGSFPTAFSPRAGEIGNSTVSMADIDDLLITTDLLGEDAVTTPKLLARSVTAGKLTIGSLGDNMVRNPGFQDSSDGVSMDNWSVYAGSPFRATGEFGAAAGDAYVYFGPSYAAIISDAFPVEQDKFYYLGAHLQGTGMYLRLVTGDNPNINASNATYFDLNYRVTDEKNDATGNQYVNNTNGLELLEGQTKIPFGHKWARVIIYSTNGGGVADSVSCRKVNGSTMIKDGAIWTDKVSAKGISADTLTVGSVDVVITLYSPVIETGVLNAGTVWSAEIYGGTIRGSAFITGWDYEARIVILDAGVKDAIRWYYPGYTLPKGEIRGGQLPDIGSNVFGVHLNSNVELGNEQSTIWQVGRRAAGDGVPASVRVRAGQFNHTTVSGKVRHNFDVPLQNFPKVTLVTLYDHWDWIMVERDNEGFAIEVWYPAGHPSEGVHPGNGGVVGGSYYFEDTV